MEYLLILWMVAILAQTRAVTPQKMLYAYVFQVVCLFWNCVFFRAPQDLASLNIFPGWAPPWCSSSWDRSCCS